MQPYFFPYVGYYQLIWEVSTFIIYDDVSYIKQGWINRNRILSSGQVKFFTAPISNASSYVSIRETKIDAEKYDHWRKKFLKTVELNYTQAPEYDRVFPLIKDVLDYSGESIAELSTLSLKAVCSYAGVETEFVDTSSTYGNSSLTGQERILDICRREDASRYVNVIVGRELYSGETFAAHGVRLEFLQQEQVCYPQFSETFEPGLSIIDVMMHNSIESIKELLSAYTLL